MNQTIDLKRIPLNGDLLVDWIFKQFLILLRNKKLRIYRIKRVMYSEKNLQQVIRGDSWVKDKQITIRISYTRQTNCSREEEISTLIHELSHILWIKTGEKFIQQMELILYNRFTDEQKRILKSFLPRSYTTFSKISNE